MNQAISRIMIFSHDFGVRKEDRGLFTAISRAIPADKNMMFDYNLIHEQSNTLTAKPLNEQVYKLRNVINNARKDYPDAVIDLVCHGQGCVIAGLVKPRGIRKVIMIAAPDDISQATVAKQLGAELAPIDPSARTRIAGSDGSTTVVPPLYWDSLAGINPVKLYNNFARVTALRMLSAKQDEVLGETTFEGLKPTVSLVRLAGNHSFDDDESRQRLLYILRKELA